MWSILNEKLGQSVFVPKYMHGVYIEQPYTREFTEAEMQQLDTLSVMMANAKMNIVYLRGSSVSASFEQLVEKFDSYDIKIFLEPNDANGPEAIVDKFGIEKFASILLADDIENDDLQSLIEKQRELEQMFPNLLTYGTGYRWDSLSKEKRGVPDINAQQNYPTGQQEFIISHSIEAYTNGRNGGQPMLANAQCFEGYEGEFPSADLVGVMGILGLIYCDGLLWYTAFSPEINHSILDYPDHWDRMAGISKFIAENEEVIVKGEKTIVENGEEVNCTWSYEGKTVEAHVWLEVQPTEKATLQASS